MADPLSLALNVAEKLMSQVRGVKTNHAVCRMLGNLVENTLKILRPLEGRLFDSPTNTALELVTDALQEAEEIVDKCSNTTFFTALLHNNNHSLEIKHAAGKLEHALSQIPLASLGMTADVLSDIVALSTQIRNAKFEESAETSRQIVALKDAFEKAFNQSGQSTEDLKNLIQEVLQQQSSSKRELKTELAVLKEQAHEANKRKEKQLEFELNQIIEVISTSLGETNDTPRVVDDLEDCLRCPISKDIMRDPVVLKDSGMIYDRSSIEEWLRRGHRQDPLTNVELMSKELIPNSALRTACHNLLAQYGVSFSSPNDQDQEVSKPRLVPGMYEGHGKLTIGVSIIHVLQLLIVEPNGKVLGYTLYKRENIIIEENMLEVGGGEWDNNSNELSFGDNQYSYSGITILGVDYQQFELCWTGKVSKAKALDEEHDFALNYLPPPIGRAVVIHPTILELETHLATNGGKIEYDNKLMLSLEVDSTIGGWMWLESIEKVSKFLGRIIEGRWDYNGTLSFRVYFPPKDNPLNSDMKTTNDSAIYRISGNISPNGRSSHSKFTAVITRAQQERLLQYVEPFWIPLDDMPLLEYTFIREASTPWYHLHPNPLKIFNLPRTYKLRSTDCSVKANFDLSYGSFSHYLRAWGRTPLHIVAWNNSNSIAKELLASGVDINEKDDNGQSPLHHAASNNSIDVVKELIAKGAILGIQDELGRSPLYVAIENNFTSIIKELLDNGVDINLQDHIGWSQLHHATNNNNLDVVKGLITNGATIDIQDKHGKSPLYIAFDENYTDIIEELLDNGANVDLQDKDGWTLICHASKNSNVEMVKGLVANDANVNHQSKDGSSPLYIASQYHHVIILKELIRNGASIELSTNIGYSPLHIACQSNHIGVVKELIADGANIDLPTKSGWTPLHIASKNNNIDVVKELVANGAKIDLQRDNGCTALYIASEKNSIDVVKELIAYGANIDLPNTDGWTPLHIASQKNHIVVVKELIANCAIIDYRNMIGWTPLHVASQNNRIDVVKVLIANGANINLQNNDGASSLHIASKCGLVSMVLVLLEHGASKKTRNNKGKTPYGVACTDVLFGPFERSTIKELKDLLDLKVFSWPQ